MARLSGLRPVLLLLLVQCSLTRASELTLPTIFAELPRPFLCTGGDCEVSGTVDIPQFDPSLGVLNMISFEAVVLQNFRIDILSNDPTIGEALPYSISGAIETPALGDSQTQSLDAVYLNTSHCICSNNFSFHYDVAANFLDPSFIGTGATSLELISSQLGPTSGLSQRDR